MTNQGTTTLWTAQEVGLATNAEARADWNATGVSIDSRTAAPGDLFIALEGPNFDGHAFVGSALKQGACAALVHRIPAGFEDDRRLLLVRDTLEGLQALGEAARSRSRAQILAVTGSVGKTSTKEMLKLVLEAQGETHATAGSFNNHWGVPLSLARLPRTARFAVFELGMNHPGEIAPLSRMVRPHVAIITTVEAVHLEFFASTADIAAAKCEIFEGLQPGGTAILNRDNPHYATMRNAALRRGGRVRTFGSHIDSQARLLDVAVDPSATSVFAMIDDHPLAYKVGIAGKQWAMNSLAVLLAVAEMGANTAAAARTLADMTPPKGRGQRHHVTLAAGSIEIIDESYNASPVSVRAAIAALSAARPAKTGRRIAVLGDMLELGPASPGLHAGLAESLTQHGIDLVFTAGALMANLDAALPETMRGGHAADSEALAPIVRQAVRAGDVVMVKGSAGSRMGRIVTALVEASETPKRAANGH
jgi:UDP-N-acetylmuramoyl-tripeptide--D-alanyl-D-alanine ligase